MEESNILYGALSQRREKLQEDHGETAGFSQSDVVTNDRIHCYCLTKCTAECSRQRARCGD